MNHEEARLCHLWETDEGAMLDRIAAYFDVLGHADRAGVPREAPEMQQFVRSLFWMARNAGAYGLPAQARRLFELARSRAIDPGLDYRLFGLASRVLGWQNTSRAAQALERWRA